MDGSCYEVEQRCDGVKQCLDGQDEMGCKLSISQVTNIKHCIDATTDISVKFIITDINTFTLLGTFAAVEKFTPPKYRISLVTRHYVQDGRWLWGGHFVMCVTTAFKQVKTITMTGLF